MTPEQKLLIRGTWKQAAAAGDAVATLFYERLFEIDPTIERLFSRTDMAAQRKKLLQALAFAVAQVDRLHNLVPVLEELGRRHLDYGVRSRHYESVGAALLTTFAEALAEDWTDEAETAWAEVYALVAGVMSAAAEQAEASRRIPA